MMDQSVDQRAVPMPCRRMHHQAGRFVDYNHIVIFKDDRKGDGFRLGNGRFGLRNGDLDHLAGFDPMVGLDYLDPGGLDLPGFDQCLDPGAAETLKALRQKTVDPFPGLFFGNGKPVMTGFSLGAKLGGVFFHTFFIDGNRNKDQELMNDDPKRPALSADDVPLEGSVLTPAQVRKLKVVVIGMGILLLVGFAVVIITIVYQASQLGNKKTGQKTKPPAVAVAGKVGSHAHAVFSAAQLRARYGAKATVPVQLGTLPMGAEIISAQPADKTFIVTLRDAGGLSLLQYDLTSWELISITRLARPAE